MSAATVHSFNTTIDQLAEALEGNTLIGFDSSDQTIVVRTPHNAVRTVTIPTGALTINSVAQAGFGDNEITHVWGLFSEDRESMVTINLGERGNSITLRVNATGTPAVLVPLPHGNGEQALNAEDLVSAGGAVLVNDSDFTAEYIRETVYPLALDGQRLAAMEAAALSIGIRDADRRMATRVLAAARKDHQS